MMQVVIVKIVRPDEPAKYIRTLVADEKERDSFVQLLQSNASEGTKAELSSEVEYFASLETKTGNTTQEIENAKSFVGYMSRFLRLLSSDELVSIPTSPYYDQQAMINAICAVLDINRIGFSYDDRMAVIHLE